jgi:hypothetical protein
LGFGVQGQGLGGQLIIGERWLTAGDTIQHAERSWCAVRIDKTSARPAPPRVVLHYVPPRVCPTQTPQPPRRPYPGATEDVHVRLAPRLLLREDDLHRVGLAAVGDGVRQDAQRAHHLPHAPALAREVARVSDHKLGLRARA